ncbi:hypothetical protein BGX31_008605 [Mortierella sp. GBA43]|nr:hypothetical protein BGX31_008605 [Mortierella sp. GBA43]
MANVDIPLQLAVPITIMIDQKACIILKRANVHTTIRDYIIRHPLDIRTIPGKDMDTGTSKDMDRDMAMDMHKSASPIGPAPAITPSPPTAVIEQSASPAAQEKRKRGRKPKTPSEPVEMSDGTLETKASSPPKEKKIKEPKSSKEPKPKKVKGSVEDGTASTGSKERSILSFFDRSTSAPSIPRPITTLQNEVYQNEGHDSSPVSPTKASGYRQSCLMFDVLEPSKSSSYVATMMAASKDDDRRFGGLMKEMPKLTGRAPYEDLMAGMLVRSAKLPNLNKLNMDYSGFDMEMLADVKMVHEFLNAFGTPLGLTKVSGEWIAFDLLLSMIRNPRIDNRLVDLHCKMISAAYEDNQSPGINQFNFPYFLAAGPEAITALNGAKEDRKNKYSSSRRKTVPLNRLGTIEYSKYTIADRIEALVKALHDITASDRFHRFMREDVEENITTLKRQKRKRSEVRKELESQVQELEREMKDIEREADELEAKRQAILATEKENGPTEDESGSTRITATSRQQRLAQTKDARSKANELFNQQKALANDLKAKEAEWESKKEELEDISQDDNEIQKDNNVPWTQLRGGHVVNADETLRVICLGSDRWGRKYWFWKEFGGVLVEDRGQVGPNREESSVATDAKQPGNGDESKVAQSDDTGHAPASISDEGSSLNNDPLNEVTQRMKTMAEPDLAGDRARAKRDDRMSINNLLSDRGSTDEEGRFIEPSHETEHGKPALDKDPLDYGPVQRWCLISTAKELASVTRALNGKGIRERVLKASLTTMRKEIEASFDRIKTWAGREYATKNDQVVSIMGAVGQPLSEEDLLLLKKKRGRKSRQELADIAATQKTLATADAAGTAGAASDENSMDVDPSSSSHLDVPMDEIGSDHEPQRTDAGSMSTREGDHDPMDDGFFATIRDSDSGSLPLEYFESIVKAADQKLQDFSRAICDGESQDAILTAIQEAQGMNESRENGRLLSTVEVLSRCLQIMDKPLMEVNDQIDQEGHKGQEGQKGQDDAKTQESHKDNSTEGQDTEADDINTNMDVTDTKSPEIPSHVMSLAIPVSVNPRLLAWFKTRHIDVMLQNVKTFGTLHAWLAEAMAAIESVVYDADDDEDENEIDEARKRKQDDHDAEDDEQDEDEDEGDDDEENDHEDDEGDEAGDEKAQEDDQEDDGDEDDEDGQPSRQRKARQKPRMKVTTIRGRVLRARNNRVVSYKDRFKDAEESEDEDAGIASRLRRSKRIRH